MAVNLNPGLTDWLYQITKHAGRWRAATKRREKVCVDEGT